MILVEVEKPCLRRKVMNKEVNKILREAKLGMPKEDQEHAKITEEAMNQRIARKYNQNVSP